MKFPGQSRFFLSPPFIELRRLLTANNRNQECIESWDSCHFGCACGNPWMHAIRNLVYGSSALLYGSTMAQETTKPPMKYLINVTDGVIAVKELLQVLQRVYTLFSLDVCLAVNLPPKQRTGRCQWTKCHFLDQYYVTRNLSSIQNIPTQHTQCVSHL